MHVHAGKRFQHGCCVHTSQTTGFMQQAKLLNPKPSCIQVYMHTQVEGPAKYAVSTAIQANADSSMPQTMATSADARLGTPGSGAKYPARREWIRQTHGITQATRRGTQKMAVVNRMKTPALVNTPSRKLLVVMCKFRGGASARVRAVATMTASTVLEKGLVHRTRTGQEVASAIAPAVGCLPQAVESRHAQISRENENAQAQILGTRSMANAVTGLPSTPNAALQRKYGMPELSSGTRADRQGFRRSNSQGRSKSVFPWS
jgi:hypothetical protein